MSDIPSEEWDFRPISENWEMPYAVLYEYCRSSKSRKILEEWFAAPFAIPYGATLYGYREELATLGVKRKKMSIRQFVEKLFEACPDFAVCAPFLVLLAQEIPPLIRRYGVVDVALRFPCFPEPWVKVKAERGKEYLKVRSKGWPKPKQALWEPRELVDQPHSATSELCHLAIEWTADAPQIKADFNKWLGTRHPGATSGRRATWERLKWLSVYRLSTQASLRYTAGKKMVDEYKSLHPSLGDIQTVFPDYDSQTSWDDAVKKATESLKGNFVPDILHSVGRMWTA